MPIVKLPDESGDEMTVMDMDGFYLPVFRFPNQEDESRSIPEWQARNDDILVCAFPKSGTHWLWEVTGMLLSGKAERVDGIKESAMLELMTQEQYNAMPSPRISNCHMYFNMLPKDFMRRKCKIIYILRNPKDIAVSLYNHHFKLLDYEYNGKWENYLPRYMKGLIDYNSWFDYVLLWEKVIKENKDLPIHVLYYENMKEDSVCEIRRLAKFLDVKEDTEFFERVSDLCDFHKMKKDKDPLEDMSEWRHREPGMYRKGEVGDWKNWFTVAQNELFDDVYTKTMSESSLTFRYQL